MATLAEMATGLEQANTAAEAKPKMEAVLAKMQALKKEEDAMGRPSKAVSDSLKKKYDPEMSRLNERVKAAVTQLAQKDWQGITTLLPVFDAMAQLGKD